MKFYKWCQGDKIVYKTYPAESNKIFRCFKAGVNNIDGVEASIKEYIAESDGSYLTDIYLGGEIGIIGYNKQEEGEYLPAGVYRYEVDESSEFFLTKIDHEISRLFVNANNPALDKLSIDIRAFLKNKQTYLDLGIPYKRGYLLYGPPGNGKTNYLLSLIGNHGIKDAVYILFEDKVPSVRLIEHLNTAHKHNTKVFIFEELTSTLNIPGNASRLLNLLDGLIGLDNYIIFATTNHPDQIPGNLIERPSRFDLILKVDVPTPSERASVLEYFLKKKPSDMAVEMSEGLSIAILKEIAIRHLIHGASIEDEITKFHELRELAKKEFAERRTFGFTND